MDEEYVFVGYKNYGFLLYEPVEVILFGSQINLNLKYKKKTIKQLTNKEKDLLLNELVHKMHVVCNQLYNIHEEKIIKKEKING